MRGELDAAEQAFQEVLAVESGSGGGVCQSGRDRDAAQTVAAGAGKVAQGGATGAASGGDPAEYRAGLLPPE